MNTLQYIAASDYVNNQQNWEKDDPGLIYLLTTILHIPGNTIGEMYDMSKVEFPYLILRLFHLKMLDDVDFWLGELDDKTLLKTCVILIDMDLAGWSDYIINETGVDFNMINLYPEILDEVTREKTIKSLIDKGWDPIKNLGDIITKEYDYNSRKNKWIMDNLTAEQMNNLYQWAGLNIPYSFYFYGEIDHNGNLIREEVYPFEATEEYDDWLYTEQLNNEKVKQQIKNDEKAKKLLRKSFLNNN